MYTLLYMVSCWSYNTFEVVNEQQIKYEELKKKHDLRIKSRAQKPQWNVK